MGSTVEAIDFVLPLAYPVGRDGNHPIKDGCEPLENARSYSSSLLKI
jgi:hypothetical protein